MTITWRPYQTELMEAVFADWQTHNSLLAVAATGAGKTNMLWGITDRFMLENPGSRVCVLAHRKELIEQPKARLEQFWPERAHQVGIVMGQFNEPHRQIVIGTVQTLGHKNGRRLRSVTRFGKIDLLIIDEAHHCSAASYQTVISTLKGLNPHLKILGVTATPERGDRKSLTETFEKESINIGVMRLIDEGHLCEPRVHGVKTNVDLSGVNIVGSGGNRDYNQQQLVAAVETEDCFKLVVKTHLEKIGSRPTIAFVPSVAGAHKLAEMLQANGVAAVAADATTPKEERAAIIRDFRTGKHTVICNVALWTEGLDLPLLECCHLVRPTKSDALYLQMVGRVLRTNEGKEFADIFDYQPLGARNLEMRMVKLGLKKKRPPLAPSGGGGGFAPRTLPKAGDTIEYVLLDYFNRRKESWITCGSGWRIVGLGKGEDNIDRSLAVAPEGTELWVIWKREGERWYQARRYATDSFEMISQKAEELIGKHSVKGVVQKAAWWRRGTPSPDQIVFGQRLGVYEDSMSKGQLSDAINQKLVMQAIQRSTDYMAVAA